MKIRADKIDDGPPHRLNAQDVRLILATVPSEWIEGLVEVRLANGRGPRAYLMHSEGRLIIYSRYSKDRQILTKILSALAAPSLNITNVVARRPSKPEQRRLDHYIQPIVDKLLATMTTPPLK
jgi:hypothetical protein